MKKLLLVYAILLASCAGKTEAEHKHIVISNDYQDTCMIVANGYRTIPIECKKGSKSKSHGLPYSCPTKVTVKYVMLIR